MTSQFFYLPSDKKVDEEDRIKFTIFKINSHTDDIEDFKKIYSQFEEQVKLNEKELAKYSLLRKKYDIYLKKLEINKDFQ